METKIDQHGTITVRTATPEDLHRLMAIGSTTFLDTFAEANSKADMDLYLKKNFSEAQVMSELKDPGNIFLVAESRGQIAGYAKMRTGKAPEELEGRDAIEIERLYAAREFIGKQVGYTLMQKCLAVARERKAETVWLGVWEHNPRAIAFYLKCGFEKFGTHAFVLGTDEQTDHLMKKDLVPAGLN